MSGFRTVSPYLENFLDFLTRRDVRYSPTLGKHFCPVGLPQESCFDELGEKNSSSAGGEGPLISKELKL